MTYGELMTEVYSLDSTINVERIETLYSTLGQEIPIYHIGNQIGPQILIEAGIHAREYPSTLVVVGIAKYLASQPNIQGGAYIIPIVNPDGIRLVLDGDEYLNCSQQKDYVRMINNNSQDYSQWKANIWAVDLNVNFDALWGGGSQNVFCPSPSNFVGYYPDSEREVRNLIDITYRYMPNLTLSFHTKGEVIYYGFETLTAKELARDEELAREISNINGYIPIKTENSTGGYSDWVSEYLGVPAFTIEVGPTSAPTPIPLELVPDAIERNKRVPEELLKILSEAQPI